MKEVSYKYCALYYLNQWLSKDKRYSETLATTDRAAKLAILKEAANFYRVSRNLPKAGDEGKKLARFAPVLDILDDIKSSDITRANVIEKIAEISGEISDQYDDAKGKTSLTSKFLWQKVKSPVVIYDSRVRTALKLNSTSYDDYYKCWHRKYRKSVSQIKQACAALPAMHEYAIDQKIGTREYIAEVAQKPWFRERVFDIYLWHVGSQ